MTLVLGHRGGSWPGYGENSVGAFRRALALGADGVELDVRRTTDDELVVFHDPLTPAGPVDDLTLAAVRASIPGVATLGEALKTCRGSLVNVELKRAPDGRHSDRVSSLVVEQLAKHVGGEVLVSSFDRAILTRVHALMPDVPLALVTSLRDPSAAADTALDHGCTALHPRIDASRRVRVAIDAAHSRGLVVHVWTVNRASHIRQLAAADVDGVITDHPQVTLRALRRNVNGQDGH